MNVARLAADDFLYGNTRLRARRASMFHADDYDALLGLDPGGVLGALARTPYAPDVEAAVPRSRAGVSRLQHAIHRHLVRTLRELRGFYSGSARLLVDLLLSTWDLRDVLTLMRGQRARADADEVAALIHGVGELDVDLAHEVARQPEFAGAVDLLITWRLPTPQDAAVLRSAWRAYERSQDLAALEHDVVAGHLARRVGATEQVGAAATPLRSALRAEADDRNLLIALRLHEAGVEPAIPPLPAGTVAPEDLATAVAAPARSAAAEELAALVPGGSWEAPLARWVQSGDLVALEDDLASERMRARMRRFLGGDPLGIDVPIAFTAALECEARNLRVITAAAARGDDPAVVRSRLVVAA